MRINKCAEGSIHYCSTIEANWSGQVGRSLTRLWQISSGTPFPRRFCSRKPKAI